MQNPTFEERDPKKTFRNVCARNASRKLEENGCKKKRKKKRKRRRKERNAFRSNSLVAHGLNSDPFVVVQPLISVRVPGKDLKKQNL